MKSILKLSLFALAITVMSGLVFVKESKAIMPIMLDLDGNGIKTLHSAPEHCYNVDIPADTYVKYDVSSGEGNYVRLSTANPPSGYTRVILDEGEEEVFYGASLHVKIRATAFGDCVGSYTDMPAAAAASGTINANIASLNRLPPPK